MSKYKFGMSSDGQVYSAFPTYWVDVTFFIKSPTGRIFHVEKMAEGQSVGEAVELARSLMYSHSPHYKGNEAFPAHVDRLLMREHFNGGGQRSSGWLTMEGKPWKK